MNYHLDSNTVIYHLANQIPEPSLTKFYQIINEGLFISVITQIEVLGYRSGNTTVDDNNESFINNANVFELTPEIVKQTIALCRETKIKLPDAIIASTAMVFGMTLLTHNIGDFNKIPGLIILDPHNL